MSHGLGSSLELPSCLSSPASVIHEHLDRLDSLVSRLIIFLAGGEEDTLWHDMETHTRGNFSSQLYKVDMRETRVAHELLIFRNISTCTQAGPLNCRIAHHSLRHSTLTVAFFSS